MNFNGNNRVEKRVISCIMKVQPTGDLAGIYEHTVSELMMRSSSVFRLEDSNHPVSFSSVEFDTEAYVTER